MTQMGVEHGDIPPTAADARPALGFRIGITGHRKLDPAVIPDLERVVDGVLADIEHVVADVARSPRAPSLYRDGPPALRVISPLAEGADRLLARVALARGWLVASPLPFPRNEYERDFPDSVAEFRDLLARSDATHQTIELDGTRVAETAAYLQVGHTVIDHSDILIAIWNGKPAEGEGGTGQIVADGLAVGIPVVHIDTEPPHAMRLLEDIEPPVACDRAALDIAMRRLLLPSWPIGKRKHEIAVVDYLRREVALPADVAADFLYRGPFGVPNTWLGRLFPAFIRTLGGKVSSGEKVVDADPPVGRDNPVVRTLYLHYQRADALATYFAAVHRSGFILIYVFGALSLIMAAFGQYLRLVGSEEWLHRAAALGEGAFLLIIAALVWAESRHRWRERWLDYRVLAESLREADLLTQCGGMPPAGSFDRTSMSHPGRGWVPWLVGAIIRSVGMVGARYDADYLARVREYAARTRLTDQIAYNERTEKRTASVSRRLTLFSRILFVATGIPIVAELALPGSSLLALFSVLFPALAAASFGVRNQAEFEIVVHRSARLRERLGQERERVLRLAGDKLTSALLIRAIRRSAQTLQGDTAEWAEIFEVKESDVS